MLESDLFIYLKNYFELNPYNEIFTEVVEVSSGRPDIVVKNSNGLITIVEMKTTISMTLLEQAINWRYKTNYIYIAVPKPKKRINDFVLRILHDYGIGLLLIDVPSKEYLKYLKSKQDYADLVVEYIKPKFFRNKYVQRWNCKLCDFFKYKNNVNGGIKGGGYNTPYKVLINDVKKNIYRKKNKPISLSELIENIPYISHHYNNPKAGLYNALTNIENKEILKTKIKGKVYFHLSDDTYQNYKKNNKYY